MAAEPEYASCDVCGRTILRGEPIHAYVTSQGETAGVCSLCKDRAEAAGWLPEALAGSLAHGHAARPRRGAAIRDRFARAAERAREAGSGAAERARRAQESRRAGRARRAEAEPAARPPRQPAREPARERASETAERLAVPAAERRPRAVPRTPEGMMRRAVERFNESQETRKIAGLIRSLGEPQAAVRADAANQRALVTVAWELSWYQWEVGMDGEEHPVREVAKGSELSELDEEARTWNAAVAGDGSLRLERAAAPPASAET